jgi:hypothetical protein
VSASDQDLRRELEGVAERERRKLGNVAEALLEWATLQLRVAGSVERLMKVQLANKAFVIRVHNRLTGF